MAVDIFMDDIILVEFDEETQEKHYLPEALVLRTEEEYKSWGHPKYFDIATRVSKKCVNYPWDDYSKPPKISYIVVKENGEDIRRKKVGRKEIVKVATIRSRKYPGLFAELQAKEAIGEECRKEWKIIEKLSSCYASY